MNTKLMAIPAAVFVAIGSLASVYGTSVLAAQEGGIYAGIAVGGLLAAALGALSLYTIGILEDEQDGPRGPH